MPKAINPCILSVLEDLDYQLTGQDLAELLNKAKVKNFTPVKYKDLAAYFDGSFVNSNGKLSFVTVRIVKDKSALISVSNAAKTKAAKELKAVVAKYSKYSSSYIGADHRLVAILVDGKNATVYLSKKTALAKFSNLNLAKHFDKLTTIANWKPAFGKAIRTIAPLKVTPSALPKIKPATKKITSVSGVTFKKVEHQQLYDSFLKDKKLIVDIKKNVHQALIDHCPIVADARRAWKSSTYRFEALSLKEKAKKLEGIQATIEYKSSKRNIKQLVTTHLKTFSDEEYIKARAINQIYMKQQKYEETFSVFRGIAGNTGSDLTQRTLIVKSSGGSTVPIAESSLVGYTTKPLTASSFGIRNGGITYERTVHRSEVVLCDTIMEYALHHKEAEFVILGGENLIQIKKIKLPN